MAKSTQSTNSKAADCKTNKASAPGSIGKNVPVQVISTGTKINQKGEVPSHSQAVDKVKMEAFIVDEFFEANRKSILKKDCCYVQVLHLTNGNVDDDGNVIRPLQLTVQPLYESLMTREILKDYILKEETQIEIFANVFEKQKDFLDKITMVNISKLSKETALKSSYFVIRRDACGSTFVCEYARKDDNGDYYSLKDNTKMNKSVFEKPEGGYKRGTKEYYFSGNSASGNKKQIQIAYDVTEGKQWVYELYNKVTLGGYSKIENPEELTFEQMIKFLGRIFLSISPSVAMFPVESFGLIKGSYDTSLDFGGKPGDGADWITRHGVAKVISYVLDNSPTRVDGKKTQVLFNGEWVDTRTLALHLQCRPINSKALATAIGDDYQRVIEMNYSGKIYLAESVDDPIAQQLVDHFLAKAKCPKGFEHIKYLKVGRKPEFIGDCDAVKVAFDIHYLGDFTVLDLPKHSETIHTNGQLLMKSLAHKGQYEKTVDLMKRLAIRHCHNGLKPFDAANLPEAKMPNVTEKPYINSVMKDICPQLLLEDRSLYESEMKNFLEGLNNDFSKMSFEVSGGFYRLVSDQSSFLLGQKVQILAENEAYSGNRNIVGLEGILEKLPSVENNELQTITMVGFKEITRRIKSFCKANDIDKTRERACINFYRGISGSCIVIARSTFLMIKLAGSDFDFDGVVVIFATKSKLTVDICGEKHNLDNLDEEVVELFKSCLEEYAVCITRDKEGPSKSDVIPTFNIRDMVDVAKVTTDGMMCSGYNVGTITNASQMMNIALIEARQGNYDLAKKIIRNVKSGLGAELFQGSYKYIGLKKENYEAMEEMYVEDKATGKWIPTKAQYEIVNISDTLLKDIIEHAKECKLTGATCIKFLEDLNMIFRFYQELVIDQSKTGERVNVQLMLTIGIQVASMKGYAFDLVSEKNDSGIIKFIKKADLINERIKAMNKNLEKSQQKDLIYYDIIDQSMTDIGWTLAAMIQEYTKNKKTYNVMEDLYLKRCSDKVSPAIIGTLKNMKGDNNNIYMRMMDLIKEMDLDEKSEEALKKNANDTINSINGVAGTLFRYIFNELTPLERGIVAKHWDCVWYNFNNNTGEGAVMESEYTSRFSNIVREEAILAMYEVAKQRGAVDCFGTQLRRVRNIDVYEDGDTITFKKGLDTNMVFAGDILDGDYTVKIVKEMVEKEQRVEEEENGVIKVVTKQITKEITKVYATKDMSTLIDNVPAKVELEDVKSIICRVAANDQKDLDNIEKALNSQCSFSVVGNGKLYAIKDQDGEVICNVRTPRGYTKNDKHLGEKWDGLYRSFQNVVVTGVYRAVNIGRRKEDAVFVILTKTDSWIAPEKPQGDVKPVVFTTTADATSETKVAKKDKGYYGAPDDGDNKPAQASKPSKTSFMSHEEDEDEEI